MTDQGSICFVAEHRMRIALCRAKSKMFVFAFVKESRELRTTFFVLKYGILCKLLVFIKLHNIKDSIKKTYDVTVQWLKEGDTK